MSNHQAGFEITYRLEGDCKLSGNSSLYRPFLHYSQPSQAYQSRSLSRTANSLLEYNFPQRDVKPDSG